MFDERETLQNRKGIKMKLSGRVEENVELDQNTLYACRLSNGRRSNIKETAWGTSISTTTVTATTCGCDCLRLRLLATVTEITYYCDCD